MAGLPQACRALPSRPNRTDDLRREPLEGRKPTLENLGQGWGIRFIEHMDDDGKALATEPGSRSGCRTACLCQTSLDRDRRRRLIGSGLDYLRCRQGFYSINLAFRAASLA